MVSFFSILPLAVSGLEVVKKKTKKYRFLMTVATTLFLDRAHLLIF